MLNKKLILSLFTVFAITSTMCFATSDENSATELQPAEATEVTENSEASEAPENTETTEATIEDNDEEKANETEEQNVEIVTTGNEEGTSEGNNNESTNTALEPKNGDLYLNKSGEDVEITDIINGNIFVKANTVTITSQVGGDLFVVAKKINIDGGQVYGNVFAVADEIVINGLVYDLYALCNTLTVSYDGTFYRDLRVACENATINGVVYGHANIITSSNLTLENDCIIRGNLYYSNPSEIEVKEGLVEGTVNYKKLSETLKSDSMNISALAFTMLLFLVFVLFVWLFMTFLTPNFTEKIIKAGKNRPIASILFGLIGIICIPIISILLLFTVIGMPISLALMFIYVFVLCISFALTSIALADIVAKKFQFLSKGKNIFAVIIVAIILMLLTYVPYISIVVGILIALYGFGIFLLALFNKTEKKIKE